MPNLWALKDGIRNIEKRSLAAIEISMFSV